MTKIYLNTNSYKNDSVYHHPDTEILLSKIIDFLAGVGQTYMVNNVWVSRPWFQPKSISISKQLFQKSWSRFNRDYSSDIVLFIVINHYFCIGSTLLKQNFINPNNCFFSNLYYPDVASLRSICLKLWSKILKQIQILQNLLKFKKIFSFK